jgi:hypothetical protein
MMAMTSLSCLEFGGGRARAVLQSCKLFEVASCMVYTLVSNITVAILAQGTSWAVAVTQAFLGVGSIPLEGRASGEGLLLWTLGRCCGPHAKM